jgi:hypothetical protein
MPDAFWYSLPGIISACLSVYLAVTQRHLIRNTNSLVDRLIKAKGAQEYDRGVSDQKNNPQP